MTVKFPPRIRPARCACPAGGQRTLDFERAERERRLARGDEAVALAQKHNVTTFFLKRLYEMRLSPQRIDSLLSSVREAARKLRRRGYSTDGVIELISRSVRVNWNNRGFSLSDLPRVLSSGVPESTILDFFEMSRPEVLH